MEMTEVTVLKCKLKPETKPGTFVNLERRTHDKEFEIRNPGAGVEKNIKKYCDVKVVKMVVTGEVEKSKITKNQTKTIESPELLGFANDLWELALNLREEIAELKAVAEKPAEITKEPKAKKQTKARKKKGTK